MVVCLSMAGCAARAAQTEETTPVITESPQAVFDRGVEFAKAGDMVRAQQYLSAARSGGHPESEVVPWLVKVAIASERYRLALDHALPYLDKNPDDWSLRFFAATVHEALHDYDAARSEYVRVTRDKVDFPSGHFHLGRLLFERFDDDEGVRAHLGKYLAQEPNGKNAKQAEDLLRRLDQPADRTGPSPVDATIKRKGNDDGNPP